MTTSEVRNLIIARLLAIAGIGQVHAYQRYAGQEKALRELYAVDGQLRGWFVRRISVIENNSLKRSNNTVQQLNGYALEKTQWQIKGYLAFNDENASELEFDRLLDAIRDSFRVTDWLPQTGGDTDRLDTGEHWGAAVEDSQPVIFAGVLCHTANCNLYTRQFRPITTD